MTKKRCLLAFYLFCFLIRLPLVTSMYAYPLVTYYLVYFSLDPSVWLPIFFLRGLRKGPDCRFGNLFYLWSVGVEALDQDRLVLEHLQISSSSIS